MAFLFSLKIQGANFRFYTDKYPKSSLHLLLLPRDPEKSIQHPIRALSDPEFLKLVCNEILTVKKFVGQELERRFNNSNLINTVKVGIHYHPSMAHLHIHILTPDHVSDHLRYKAHYNSFNTPFFVRLNEFPNPDLSTPRGQHLHDDLICWNCGKNFGSSLKLFKQHLVIEFDAWKVS